MTNGNAIEKEGSLRYAFKLSAWDPEGEEDGEEFQYLLQLLPKEEIDSILRFRFFADKQRALISRLLQRTCIEKALKKNWYEIQIKRTKGRKPFFCNSEKPDHVPNFNYNVSHEGDYIVLASEPTCVVGVDISAPGQARKNGNFTFANAYSSFKSQFTEYEWRHIKAFPDVKRQEDAFRRNWSCKEAFTKARGDGIGFDLGRCEFHIKEAEEGSFPCTHHAQVYVDNKIASEWAFFLQPLGDHWVTVSRGPPSDIVDAYGEFSKTFQKRTFSSKEWSRELNAPNASFALVGIRDIIPQGSLEGYEAIRGEEDPFS